MTAPHSVGSAPDWEAGEISTPPEGGFVASAKQSIGSAIKGAGQAAADFIPGVGQDNAVKRYGQEVIDANPTAVKSLGDIADNPGTAVKEAVGNAAGSMGPMIGARLLGQGITAAAPLTGPFAPVTAAVGQGVAWLGPAAAAALPSFGGIREQQIKDDPSKADDLGAKARAATGAAAVGAIESKFGPQEWALGALSKDGRAKLAEKFAAKTLGGSVAKGAATGAAVEGAEELVQNPIEQIAAYQDPTTAENVQDTLFGGAMGAIGGGVLGGGFGGVSRAMGSDEKAPGAAPAEAGGEEPGAAPLALPAPTYTGTPTDQILQAEAERQNQVDEAQARARDLYQRRDAFDAARTPPEQEGPDLSPVRESNAARLDALGQQEAGEPDVPQTAPPDGRSILNARRNAEIAAGRAMTSPDDEILQSIGAAEPPHLAMGIDPAAGPLSAGAAIAVDTGVHQAVTAPVVGPLESSASEHGESGKGFKVGQTWGKPGGGARYTIRSVSDDGKLALAEFGRGRTATVHFDAEVANGWKSQQSAGASQEESENGNAPASRWDSLTAQERAEVAARAGLPPVIARNIPRAGWESLNGDLQARISTAMAPVAKPATSAGSGASLGDGWAAFPPESGTLAVPRAQMPQIKAEHRGAMTNFMNARGVSHTTEEVPADSLRPTQAEFSPEKVKKAAGFEGGDRSILVSSDNYVLDGHHQWLAKREADAPVKVIRLNAPIQQLIGLAHEFPSSTTAGGANASNGLGDRGRAAAAADDLRAMSQDAGWAERGGLLIRDSAGNATGRTKWLPRAEWFMAGMEADPATLARDIDRYVNGEKVPAKSRRTVEGMLDWLDTQRGEPRLDEDASAYDFEAAGIGQDASEDAMLIGEIFAEAAPQEDAAVMRALGFTEQEIQDVVGPQEDRAGQGSARQPDAGRAQEAGEVARGDAQAQGEARSEGSPEGLTSYSNEDIARQEAAQRDAASKEERARREADQKAQADAERDTFTLTGSDRTADVLAAQGQGGLFDQAAAAPKPQAAPPKANPGARWDSLTAEQRAAILTQPGGWSTAAGGLNVIGKQLARKGWEQITAGTRSTIERLMEKARNQESIKNEPRADAGPAAAAAPANQEAVKKPEADFIPASESYNDRVRRMAREARIGRLQEDQTITQANGKPFKTAASARAFSDDNDLGDTHEAVARDGGFVLQKLPSARRPSAIARQQQRREADPETQRQETAFARAEKIGPEAEAAVTAYENGDTSIEEFEAALDAAEQPAVGEAPSPIEAIFSGLNSDSTRKANKARRAAAKLPQAARIDYVQANFHDLLIQMMGAGVLEVNGATTLTEDNKPCL